MDKDGKQLKLQSVSDTSVKWFTLHLPYDLTILLETHFSEK